MSTWERDFLLGWAGVTSLCICLPGLLSVFVPEVLHHKRPVSHDANFNTLLNHADYLADLWYCSPDTSGAFQWPSSQIWITCALLWHRNLATRYAFQRVSLDVFTSCYHWQKLLGAFAPDGWGRICVSPLLDHLWYQEDLEIGCIVHNSRETPQKVVRGFAHGNAPVAASCYICETQSRLKVAFYSTHSSRKTTCI